MEVAGIKIKNIRFIIATNDIRIDENKHCITIFIVVGHDFSDAKLIGPEKFETWLRFGWNNLPKPLFLPTKKLLKQRINLFNLQKH